MTDADRVKLKRNGAVEIDGADTGWTWLKVSGFHSEYVLRHDKNSPKVRHYKRKTFVLKVLDFHNGCGEFA